MHINCHFSFADCLTFAIHVIGGLTTVIYTKIAILQNCKILTYLSAIGLPQGNAIIKLNQLVANIPEEMDNFFFFGKYYKCTESHTDFKILQFKKLKLSCSGAPQQQSLLQLHVLTQQVHQELLGHRLTSRIVNVPDKDFRYVEEQNQLSLLSHSFTF